MKYKFDKFNETASQKKEGQNENEAAKDIERFDASGNVRNLYLVDADGKQFFLNYAYLMSGEYVPNENTVALFFTTHTVTIKGRNLESIFQELTVHAVRYITVIDKRYASLKGKEPFVTALDIKSI